MHARMDAEMRVGPAEEVETGDDRLLAQMLKEIDGG